MATNGVKSPFPPQKRNNISIRTNMAKTKKKKEIKRDGDY
jgi:hypothetical protein